MDATANRWRIAQAQAKDATYQRAYVSRRVDEITDGAQATPYRAYAGASSQAGVALTLLRTALVARASGSFNAQLQTLPDGLANILALCVPYNPAIVSEDDKLIIPASLASAFYASLSELAMSCGNVPQVRYQLELRRQRIENTDFQPMEYMLQRTIRGLLLLETYFQAYDAGDSHAIHAIATKSAEIEHSASAHRYWHALTDDMSPAPKRNKEYKAKRSHAARAERERRNGHKVHH